MLTAWTSSDMSCACTPPGWSTRRLICGVPNRMTSKCQLIKMFWCDSLTVIITGTSTQQKTVLSRSSRLAKGGITTITPSLGTIRQQSSVASISPWRWSICSRKSVGLTIWKPCRPKWSKNASYEPGMAATRFGVGGTVTKPNRTTTPPWFWTKNPIKLAEASLELCTSSVYRRSKPVFTVYVIYSC